jgi:hypothetical protein
MKTSAELSRRLTDTALRIDSKDRASWGRMVRAFTEQFIGDSAAVRSAHEALSISSTDRNTMGAAAVLFALAGRSADSNRLIQEASKNYPEDTFIQVYFLPTARAAQLLSDKHPDAAIQALKPVEQYDLGFPAPGLVMLPTYVRGLAYLQAKQPTEARAQFQKILDHRGLIGSTAMTPLAHLGIARAEVLAGDTAKARTAYQDFFAIWKDADPDIPILTQAKAEYAKLR